jgi:uncharacterized protein with HEPN domain
MRGKIGDRVRLQHIPDAIIEIETYSFNTDFSGFIKNSMMRFACIKQMEIIGEAGNHVSDGNKTKFSAIESPRAHSPLLAAESASIKKLP